jgi:FkbM family methyltransferase
MNMLKANLLNLAYKGEVFFSRLQGIEFDRQSRNGEFCLVHALRHCIKIAVDIGANIGDWTDCVLRETAGSAIVACVEPDPDNAEYLRARFGTRLNVTVREAAIAASEGMAAFERVGGKHSGAGHLAAGMNTRHANVIQVPVVTLTNLCTELQFKSVDLVKCDIEGFEMEALAGAKALFERQAIGTMQVEYNATWLRTGYRMQDLFSFAVANGYAILAATPVGFTRYPIYTIGLEDFRLRNFALVRKDHLEMLNPFGPTGRARVECRRLEFLARERRAP